MLGARKTLYVALACMLGATVTLTGCNKEQKAGAMQQMPPTVVTVVTMKPQPIEITTRLTGRTNAYYTSEIRPQVSGVLLKRYFQEGQMVKAGEPLYLIDPAPYEAQLKTAQATLATAKANLTKAAADAKRSSELLKVQAVSKQSDDAMQAAYLSAKAAVKSGEAAVKTAQINLTYTKVESPITGTVSRSEFTEGALLQAYQTNALTTVTQMDPMYVDVTQTAEDLLRFKREIAAGTLKTDKDGAATVRISFGDNTEYELPGKLTFTGAIVDESTGTVHLRAVIPNPKGELLPGMFVRATVVEGQRPEGFLVPMQSVMRDSRSRPYVYVIDADNKVTQRYITINQTIGTSWVVDSGIKAGDKVMFSGFQHTRPGATVKTQELDPQTLADAKPLF